MEETLADLAADFTELAYLASSAIQKLSNYKISLEAHRADYTADSYEYLCSQTGSVSASYAQLSVDVDAALQQIRGGIADMVELIEKKKSYALLLRILQSSLGSVLSAGQWQSPSFEHSTQSQAGNETGQIVASSNDYKRDAHKVEAVYGQQFAKAYIDTGMHVLPVVFATSSGMSAVATALSAALQGVQPNDVVLVGASSYFQNKRVVETLFPGKIIYVDEFDTETILALAKQHKPLLVFLDSLSNAESLAMPNLQELIPRLGNILPRRSTLVIDNTGMATACQPLSNMPLWPFGMGLIVLESLIKYHEFGFDRANGGILWASLPLQQKIFELRMHLGTIIPDASVLALPTPNRTLFDSRLSRIGRNTLLLAQRIETFLQEMTTQISHVVYPGLATYPGYAWTKHMQFRGGFFILVFKEKYRHIQHYDAYIARVMSYAKKYGVDIVGGSSFGFNTTRIYLTARHAEETAQPFVRVSVGTETMEEIDLLTKVFTSALTNEHSS